MFLLKSRGRKQFFVVAREALGRIWAVAGRQGRLWAFSRSYFFKVKWILNEFLPKLDRLVLGCINEFLNFFFEFVERVLLIRSFLKKNAKIRKKKEREKFEWKLQKSWFLRIFRLWGGPKEAISTSFWILSSRWRRMQPNLGPCEEINQKFNEILVKKFGRS